MKVIKLPSLPAIPQKKRVAAYARVSTGKDAMLHSLSAQVSYYSDYIQQHPDWLYSGVYTDEAVTGTKTMRPEFQRLIGHIKRVLGDVKRNRFIARTDIEISDRR